MEEENCIASTFEKKYYSNNRVFVKRNLKKKEYRRNKNGDTIFPYKVVERMRNEVEAINLIREKTSVPVPEIYRCIEDDGALYVIMEHVEGKTLKEVKDEEVRNRIIREVESYMEEVHKILGREGSVTGKGHLIYQVSRHLKKKEGVIIGNREDLFPLCHNDLNEGNIIVDERRCRVKSIIDWEYAGYNNTIFDNLLLKDKELAKFPFRVSSEDIKKFLKYHKIEH